MSISVGSISRILIWLSLFTSTSAIRFETLPLMSEGLGNGSVNKIRECLMRFMLKTRPIPAPESAAIIYWYLGIGRGRYVDDGRLTWVGMFWEVYIGR